jgi:predicted phage terminase large subunit-like protein
MERHGHLKLDAAVRDSLLSMSAATMDRVLRTVRDTAKQGRRRSLLNTPLRKSIAVRTFGDWHDPSPGFFEMDMVVHCGKSTVGSYIHSLVLTDIASGWTEAIAMVVREQTLIIESVSDVRTKLPFTVRGLDVDNDSASVNATLVEDKANGPAVISTLRQEIPALTAVNPEGGKESRAAAVAPLIEAGNVYLPLAKEDPWIADTLLEFSLFPAAKNDDRVDAASQALLYLLKKRRQAFDPAIGKLFGEANQALGPRTLDSSFWGNPDAAPSVSVGDSDLWDYLTFSSGGDGHTLRWRRR